MAHKKLKGIFKEAAAIAKVVPEELREAAFNRALDRLMGEEGRNAGKRRRVDEEPSAPKRPFERPFSALAETAHVETILEKSVEVLNLATGTLGIEAMTAEQIAEMLDEKFGIVTSNEMVARVLENTDGLVRRVREGGGAVYRLIRPVPAKKRTAGKRKTASKAKTKARAKGKTRAKAAGRAKAGGDDGESGQDGAQLLLGLAGKGFLATARTTGEIILFLQRKGFEITARELTPLLIRLLKAGLLARDGTGRGRYKYRVT